MPKVSQFSSPFSKVPAPPVELMAVLSAIKNGRWQKQIEHLRTLKGKAFAEAKKTLAGFTVTGTFDRRADDGFETHSGFIQADIDKKDNPDISYDKMWKAVTSAPFTYAAFRSPSGNGIKVIVKCPPDKEQHAGSYKAAAQWLQDRGIHVDSQVCALSQLCFVSSDPELFVNNKATAVRPLPVEAKEHALVEFEEERSKEEILEACKEQFEHFESLWQGEYEHITQDHSTADHMLICMLRDNCFSGELIAEMFEESGLFRESKYPGRCRDYVFKSLKKSDAVQSLGLLDIIPEDPKDPSPEKKKKHKGWGFLLARDVPEWQAEDDKYIVKKLLFEGTTACAFGEPGSGKTFVVFDLCAAVAAGREWNGYKTKRGGVAYFGLEGFNGVRKRVQAMKKEGRMAADDPFAIMDCRRKPLNLMEDEHVKLVCEAVANIEAESGHQCKIIVIDTLTRATPGGDENAVKDMGQVLNRAQQIADRTGCAVLVIHHSAKAGSLRGSSALQGAFDSIYKITRHPDDPSIRIFHSEKQKDEAEIGDLFYRLTVVELGLDDDLEPVTSCIVDFLTGDQLPQKKIAGGGDYKLIQDAMEEDGSTIEEVSEATGISKGTTGRKMRELLGDGTLRYGNGRYYLVKTDDIDDFSL